MLWDICARNKELYWLECIQCHLPESSEKWLIKVIECLSSYCVKITLLLLRRDSWNFFYPFGLLALSKNGIMHGARYFSKRYSGGIIGDISLVSITNLVLFMFWYIYVVKNELSMQTSPISGWNSFSHLSSIFEAKKSTIEVLLLLLLEKVKQKIKKMDDMWNWVYYRNFRIKTEVNWWPRKRVRLNFGKMTIFGAEL